MTDPRLVVFRRDPAATAYPPPPFSPSEALCRLMGQDFRKTPSVPA